MQGKLRHSGPIGRSFKDNDFSFRSYWATRYITGLTITVDSDTQFTLNWTNNGGGDWTGTKVYISTNGTDYTLNKTISTVGTSTIVTGLIPSTLYYIKVAPYKSSNVGTLSDADNSATIATRGTDAVWASNYQAIGSAAGLGGSTLSRYLINIAHNTRIRTNGSITKVKIYIGSLANVGNLYFQVWRKDGTTYDRIGQEDILSKLSANSLNEITLTNPISVQEGDCTGIGIISSGGTPSNTLVWADNYTNGMYYVNNEIPSENNYDWESKSGTSYTVSLRAMIQSPMIVGIGDSIMAGHGVNYSFIELAGGIDIDSTILYKLFSLNNNMIYQNMGVGGQTTTAISSRFMTDCRDLKPKYAVINGGVNDLAGGIITKTVFLNNWKFMLDACKSNYIIPIVCKIMPWSNGTNTQMEDRDEWNADLKTLVETYENYVLVDFDILGEFREGGVEGNKWNIKSEYDFGDGVHFNEAANTVIANLIYTGIISKSNAFPSERTYNVISQAYFNSMTLTPDIVDKEKIDDLVNAIDEVNGFDSLDSLQLCSISHNTYGEALIDLLVPTRDGTNNGALHTPYEGFSGDGNDYIAFEYVIDGTGKLKQNDACVFVYNRQNLNDSTYLFATGGSILYLTSNSTTALIRLCSGGGASVNVGSHIGFHWIQRSASDKMQYSKNGGNLVEYTTSSSGLDNAAMNILGRGASQPSTGEVAVIGMGKSMTQEQITAIFNAIETYLDYYGKGVIS